MCAIVPERTRAGCRMSGLGGLGLRERGGEGAQRGTSVRRPRSCAASSSERAVGNSAVDAPLSHSWSCIVCVCVCVWMRHMHVCVHACPAQTVYIHDVFAYLFINSNENAARAHTRNKTHIHLFSLLAPHTSTNTHTRNHVTHSCSVLHVPFILTCTFMHNRGRSFSGVKRFWDILRKNTHRCVCIFI